MLVAGAAALATGEEPASERSDACGAIGVVGVLVAGAAALATGEEPASEVG